MAILKSIASLLLLLFHNSKGIHSCSLRQVKHVSAILFQNCTKNPHHHAARHHSNQCGLSCACNAQRTKGRQTCSEYGSGQSMLSLPQHSRGSLFFFLRHLQTLSHDFPADTYTLNISNVVLVEADLVISTFSQ